MWWFFHQPAYGLFLGLLLKEGLQVDWLPRENFPQAPAVEKPTDQLEVPF